MPKKPKQKKGPTGDWNYNLFCDKKLVERPTKRGYHKGCFGKSKDWGLDNAS